MSTFAITKKQEFSQSAADKVQRYAKSIGVDCMVVWSEENRLYRVHHKGDMLYFDIPNDCVKHIIELAKTWRKELWKDS